MSLSLPSLLSRFRDELRDRVRSRPDTEFQQALIRVVIGAAFYAYFATDLVSHPAETSVTNVSIASIFVTLSVVILLATVIHPHASVPRRVFGALLDFSVTTVLLLIGGETSAPLVVIYFWVPMGNGFRYGVNYLYLSTLLAASGFLAVLLLNDFWLSHLALGFSILLTMVAVPLYTASLLRQLHSAIRRAQEANQAKSSFLANMSHELRTPLNGVIGVADLLSETRLDREQKELAQIIRSSAETLLGLIENVLDISRIEAGRLVMHEEQFDLHVLVNRTVQMLGPVARKKEIVLAAHIAPQTPFQLHGDAPHLRQILINLLGNAIKFTEAGRVDLYVRPATLGEAPRLYFEVVDTGIGIPEAAQSSIFESFSQADLSITRRYGGTGLGTTIARQLTELMGGRMGFRSQEGVGSVFWFEIPFRHIPQALEPGREGGLMKGRVAILARGETGLRLEALVRGWGLEPLTLPSGQAVRKTLLDSREGEGRLAAIVLATDSLPHDPAAFLDYLDVSGRHGWPPLILIESDPDNRASPEARLLRAGYAAVLAAPVNPSLLFNAVHAAVSTALPENVVSIADHFQSKAGTVRLRILVADDNPVNQRVTRGLMEHAGHEVITARDGEEALALLETDEAIQLAIIDMQMPELSGTDVVRAWRYMEQGHLPIIILTADAREESKQACREAGADAFLTKPVKARDLVDTVAQFSAMANVSAAAQGPAPRASRAPLLEEGILDDLASLGGGTEFVAGLIDEFTRDSLRAFEAIEQALRERDYPQWREQFHTLKGGASDVGAHELASLCVDAERVQPFELGSSLARERLDRVRQAWTAAGAALTEYLSRQTSARGH